MKTVLVFGTFDVIHPGHEYFLRQSASYGDKLVAVIARDNFVSNTKMKIPINNQKERIAHIINSGLVDDAYLSDEVTGSFAVISKVNPQVICFGHDQIKLAESFKNWLKISKREIELVIIDPYQRDKYSSTIRNKKFY